MNRLLLEIGEVVVETEVERLRVEGAEEAVAEAFRLLADRLERTPVGEIESIKAHAVDLLKTSALPLDEVLSPRGAERLADELYRQLVRRRA